MARNAFPPSMTFNSWKRKGSDKVLTAPETLALWGRRPMHFMTTGEQMMCRNFSGTLGAAAMLQDEIYRRCKERKERSKKMLLVQEVSPDEYLDWALLVRA